MKLRIGIFVAVTALSTAGVTACGSGATKTVTDTTSGTPKAPPSAPSVPSAVSVVRNYYDSVNAGEYQAAWAAFSTTLQQRLGGFGQWKTGYDKTLSTRLVNASIGIDSPVKTVVVIQLRATALDACGNTIPQAYSGTWTLSKGRKTASFTARRLSLTQTGGGTGATDASTCGDTTDTTPTEPATTQTSCDSSYTGACLDPNSPDYDCIGGGGDGPDYTGTVQVVGDDHFGLDANNNGIGCE